MIARVERHRQCIRLVGFDYTQPGVYFVTICTASRANFLGDVVGEQVELTNIGQIVRQCWSDLPKHFLHITLGEFVLMPNHLHGLIEIKGNTVGARHALPLPSPFRQPIPGSLPTIVGSFKSASTKLVNRYRGTPGVSLWQRNYYEHIVRDDDDLASIAEYILANPAKWADDADNLIVRPGVGR